MLILNKQYTFSYNGVNRTGIYIGTFIIIKFNKYNFSKSFISDKNIYLKNKLNTDYFNENHNIAYDDMLNLEYQNIINDDKFNNFLIEINMTESDFFNNAKFINTSIHKYHNFYDEIESKIIYYHN